MQCPVCHNEVGPQTAFCNHCGASLAAAAPGAVPPEAYAAPPTYSQVPPAYTAPPVAAGSSGLSPNAASALAYVTIIPAIFFLAMEPYNKIPLVRFHSFQSIGLAIVWFATWVVLFALQLVLHFIPLSFLLFGLLNAAVGFGLFIVWVFTILKAVKGEWFKLPFIGDFAEKQARS